MPAIFCDSLHWQSRLQSLDHGVLDDAEPREIHLVSENPLITLHASG